MAQVVRRKRRQNSSESKDVDEPLSDEYTDNDILAIFLSTSNCCTASKSSGGCIAVAHKIIGSDGRITTDMQQVMTFIRCARAERGKLSGQGLDNFIQEKFRSVVESEVYTASGETRYKCNWNYHGIHLCRQSFGAIFGISKRCLDKCSKAIKNQVQCECIA